MTGRSMRGSALLAVCRFGLLGLCASLAACAGASSLPPAPAPQTPAQLERWRTPPPLEPEPELALALGEKGQRISLANQLSVTVVPRPDSPTTAIRLWVPSAADVWDGPLVLVAEALRAGTQIAPDQVLVNPRLGESEIGISTDRMGTELGWQVLPRATKHAIELLAHFVLQPVFEPAELRVRLRQEVAAIDSHARSYARIGDLARGGLPLLETPSPEQGVRRLIDLRRDQILHLYRCSMRPEKAELVIVGPVAAEAALGWARQAFGSWQAGPRGGETGCAPAAPLAKAGPPQLKEPLVQLLEGSLAEPHVWLALPGPARESEDFLAFALLAEVLKNRDGSLLQHADTTAAMGFDVDGQYQGFSVLEVSGQLDSRDPAGALRKLMLSLRALETELTEAELEATRRSEMARYVDALRSERALASQIVRQLQAGRTPDAVYEWPGKLRGWSLPRTREVAGRWLSSAQPSIVVSNPPRKLIQSLGFPVTVRHLRWTLSSKDE